MHRKQILAAWQTIALGVGGIFTIARYSAAALLFPDYRRFGSARLAFRFYFLGRNRYRRTRDFVSAIFDGRRVGRCDSPHMPKPLRALFRLSQFYLFRSSSAVGFEQLYEMDASRRLINEALVKHAIEHRGMYQPNFGGLFAQFCILSLFGIMMLSAE